MKKLGLAVFNSQPPTYLGGVERRILEIAKRLQGKVKTTVYSGTKGGLHEPNLINDVPVIPCFSTDIAFPLDNWTFNQTLARNTAVFKAEVYEAHTAGGYGLLEALRKRGDQAPFVQTVHGVLADEYAQAHLHGGLSFRSRIANLFMWHLAQKESEAAQHATLVVTISKYSQRRIRQFYNVDLEKTRVVPNGVDPERFKPEGNCAEIRRRLGLGGKRSVLFVGRLIPRKGLSYLVEAAKCVVKEQRETVFVIAGDGPLRSHLIAEVVQAGLAKNFSFLGDVAEVNLPAVYRCADVFAFPSLQEGQGIALLEAQASAKPVVAFNTSGIAEAVLNGQTGLLVRPNSGELAEAILRLLSDAPLRAKIGAEGRRFVQRELSWDVCSEKMFKVYREALEHV